MKLTTVLLSTAVAAVAPANAANAYVVYNNPADLAADVGNCRFSTACSAAVGAGDDFAAQRFTITKAHLIDAASFSELDLGTTPTDVNWGFLNADGPGGLPGSILAAGTDAVGSATPIGSGTVQGQPASFEQIGFQVGSIFLQPGTYYFAVQAISPVFDTYLSQGANNSGAAESRDGGVTWAGGYAGIGGVAIGLYSVPEPAVWALFPFGLAAIGIARRNGGRRRTRLQRPDRRGSGCAVEPRAL